MKQLQKNPIDKDADLIPILEGPVVNPWMPWDIEEFNEARSLFGDDLQKIKEHIGTKSIAEIKEFIKQ